MYCHFIVTWVLIPLKDTIIIDNVLSFHCNMSLDTTEGHHNHRLCTVISLQHESWYHWRTPYPFMTAIHDLHVNANYTSSRVVEYCVNSQLYLILLQQNPEVQHNQYQTLLLDTVLQHSLYIYRMSHELRSLLRKGVPYVKIYRYNP
jgi:hypothetical protein